MSDVRDRYMETEDKEKETEEIVFFFLNTQRINFPLPIGFEFLGQSFESFGVL